MNGKGPPNTKKKKKMNKKWHARILVVDGLSNVGKELGKEGGR